MNDTGQADTPTTTPAKIVCPPAKDPAVRWFIFAAMAIGLAIWCWIDRQPKPTAWNFKHINEIADYLFNNWGPVVFAPLGLIATLAAIRQLKRKLQADEQTITYAGQSLAWGDIDKIDASKLTSKGIIVLHAADGSRLKLDSWKLQNFKELVAFIERKLPDAERIGPED